MNVSEILFRRGSRREPALISRKIADFTVEFEPTHAGCCDFSDRLCRDCDRTKTGMRGIYPQK
jgi:hypothetical protein